MISINLEYGQNKFQDPIYPALTCSGATAATGTASLAGYATLAYLASNHYTKSQTDPQNIQITATSVMQTDYFSNAGYGFPYVGSISIVPASNVTLTLPPISSSAQAYEFVIRRYLDGADPASAGRTVQIVSGDTIDGFPGGITMSANDSVVIASHKSTVSNNWIVV
jgi:hypothetical protein